MHTKQLKYDHGFYFPIMARITGGVLFLCAIFISLGSFEPMGLIIGLAIILMFSMVFTKTVVTINPIENKLNFYINLFGIQLKQKSNLDKYLYVTLVHRNFSLRTYSRSYVGINSSFSLYQILLLNETHHKKFVVNSYTNAKEAESEAKKLSKALNWNYVKYDPVRTRKKNSRKRNNKPLQYF